MMNLSYSESRTVAQVRGRDGGWGQAKPDGLTKRFNEVIKTMSEISMNTIRSSPRLARGVALVLLQMALVAGMPPSAWALSSECETVPKLAQCCLSFQKALKGKVNADEYNTARECENELIGARDQAGDEKMFGVCIPDSESLEKLLTVFLGYSGAHPEAWNRVARFGLLSAWGIAWPCGK